MKTFSFIDSCLGLIGHIQYYGHEIAPHFLTARPEASGSHPVQHTFLYDRLIDFWDLDTKKWIENLHDKTYKPDWHAVEVPWDTPIEFNEHVSVAKSLQEALGYVLEQMNAVRAIPSGFQFDEDGSIQISHKDGVIASIYRVKFEHVPEMTLARAARAMKGIHKYSSNEYLAKRFSKLNGYPKFPAEVSDQQTEGFDTGMIDLNASNLCWAMQQVLKDVVKPNIPLNQLQEITARFYGFESWNHFSGACKNREDDLAPPFMLIYEKTSEPDPNLPITFYKGIKAGISAFGEHLLKHERKSFQYRRGLYGFNLSNIRFSTTEEFKKSGNAYFEDEGISLNQCAQIYCDDTYANIAESLLSLKDKEKTFKDYFCIGHTPQERLLIFNKRAGINNCDHLFIDNWAFYCKQGDSLGEGYFCVELVSNLGRKSDSNFYASLHKLSVVKDDLGNFWFANDWDRKPKFMLENFTFEKIQLIQTKFIHSHNWIKSL